MNACLFSPYFPKHFGGGEMYFLSVAKVLSQKYSVQIAIPSLQPLAKSTTDEIRHAYEAFLDDSLASIEFVASPLGTKASAWTKNRWTTQFDVLYYITDGSFFWSSAKRNIAHIQFPLQLNKRSWWEQLKLWRWQTKNTNSEFTKKIVEASWPVKVDYVHYPQIDIRRLTPQSHQRKEKIILHVGRFFRQLHTKRQDVLVATFKELLRHQPTLMSGWKLVLVGGVEDEVYAQEVAEAAKGFPIEIHHHMARTDLIHLFQAASIYWHATGYEVDEQAHPEQVEHFGISTLEAMAAGAVPIVHGKGGQVEILENVLPELLWQTPAECQDITQAVISDSQLRVDLALRAMNRAADFGPLPFEGTLWQMVA